MPDDTQHFGARRYLPLPNQASENIQDAIDLANELLETSNGNAMLVHDAVNAYTLVLVGALLSMPESARDTIADCIHVAILKACASTASDQPVDLATGPTQVH